jgi:hypothetical protein
MIEDKIWKFFVIIFNPWSISKIACEQKKDEIIKIKIKIERDTLNENPPNLVKAFPEYFPQYQEILL